MIVEAALAQGGGSISPWIAAHGEARFVEHGHGALLERFDGSGRTGSGPAALHAFFARRPPFALYRMARALVEPIGRDVGRRLLELHMPWTYVAGAAAGTELTDQDQATLEEAGAEILRVPHAGHLLPWENPRGLATALGCAVTAACSSRSSGAGYGRLMARTVIVGGGFGGIAVATELRRRLGDDHEAVLIDADEEFSMGLRKLWELVGIGTITQGSRSRRRLAGGGIEFVHARVEEIDPVARTVRADGRAWQADFLVVALGAQPRPDLVPGLTEHAHDVWERARVPAARVALEAFERGRIAVVIAGGPYPCPPAPYECAMLVDQRLRERGIRERAQLVVSTFQPMLLPNVGRPGSEWLGEQLAARGIDARVGRKVEWVESGRVVYSDGELEADLVIGVPPHRPPGVVTDAGLAGESGWVSVDPATLATRWPGVFAVGDVTQIKLANDLPLPKAGIIAEREGTRVAAAIAAEIGGADAPAPFDGHGHCFVELSPSSAALIEGEFFAKPEPAVHLREPSRQHAEHKRRFETERLAQWFGG